MDSKIIGKRMRELRQKRRMTTAEFSKKVGLSQPQISRLESGRQGFRSKTLARIATVLEVDMAYFLQEWAPNGTILTLRLGSSVLESLRDPVFSTLVTKLAKSKARQGSLYRVCVALVDVLKT